MRRQYTAVACAFACMVLGGCSQDANERAKVERQLTVTGPKEGLDRFVKLQTTARPVVEVVDVKSLPNGQKVARMRIPVGYDGEDLIHTTREALAADLNYKFEEHRTVESAT